MIPLAPSRRFWESQAASLAWRINLAAWLERAGPVTFFIATAFAIAFYALRRVELGLGWGWGLFTAALVGGAAATLWRARRRFFASDEARVLLESSLRLDTRLTAASLGLTAWPGVPLELPPVVQWRLRTSAGWFGGAALLLALALVAPVARDPFAVRPSGPPPALLQTEEMLDALQQLQVAEPQAIEQLAERAQELAQRSPEEQYSHSALEAADALRNQTAVAAANLARGLDAAANAMQAANGADMAGAAGQLSAALSGLRGGAMPANKSLLANLPGNAIDLSALTAEQRAQLAQQLGNAAQAVNGVAGAGGAGASVAPGAGRGQGSGNGRNNGWRDGPDNENSDGTGSGGSGRGGGHAPLNLAADPSDAGDGRSEALKSDALKNFALGDKLGTSAGAHDVDPAKTAGPMSAGAVAAPASGGEAVWVNRLTPTERAALNKFFK